MPASYTFFFKTLSLNMVLGIVYISVKKKQFLTVDGRIAASGNEIEATVKF